jgi:hypothetical protein
MIPAGTPALCSDGSVVDSHDSQGMRCTKALDSPGKTVGVQSTETLADRPQNGGGV